MNAHFINIDILFENESRPCIVSKESPNIPILKMEPYQFKLFKSGVYKNQGNKIKFNGKDFWLPTSFMEKLKISAKKHRSDISKLAISMQEFMNSDIIDNFDFKINESVFKSMVNTKDDIYIITSKNTKRSYQKLITKIEEVFKENGLLVKDYYHISETFYNTNEDDVAYTKANLVLQHLIGLKTHGKGIINEDITNYEQISYYDDSINAIETMKNINSILERVLTDTPDEVKSIVKDRLKNVDNIVKVKQYTHNQIQKFNETIVSIEYSNVIRSFENFK